MPGLTRRVAIAAAAGLAAGFGASVSAAPVRAGWVAAPGDMNLGNPRARVRVVEYMSLTCAHCAHFNSEVFPAFKTRYIDTGRVFYTARELLTAPAQVAAAGVIFGPRLRRLPYTGGLLLVDEPLVRLPWDDKGRRRRRALSGHQ